MMAPFGLTAARWGVMDRVAVIWVAAMIAVIVGVDPLVFRDHAWPRLMVNVGIVLMFGAFYLRFVRR